MVKIKINEKEIVAKESSTILEVAKANDIKIPTLCYKKDINETGACRICVVELEGYDKLVTSCNTEIQEGMVISTNSKKVIETRNVNLKLILGQHKSECTECVRNNNCELQALSSEFKITDNPYKLKRIKAHWNEKAPFILDGDKCVKCLRCVNTCRNVQAVGALELKNTGGRTCIGVAGSKDINTSKCTYCGQCVVNCPVGALKERSDIDKVMEYINDDSITTMVQMAPAIRAAWGEEFGLPPGETTANKLASVFREIGFDYVFDTDFGADLTIMEEAFEFLERFTSGDLKDYPMFTSCCPGWVRYAGIKHPNILKNLSSAKSPHQMFGALMKSYFKETKGIDPKNIRVVSIMPCIAKKFEAAQDELSDASGNSDVDAVLSTREVNRLIKSYGIDVKNIEESEFDKPFKDASGAGHIFGATGGVMEAALRTAYYYQTKTNPEPNAFKAVRGDKGWREAVFDINGTEIKVAVTSGLKNCEDLLTALENGEVKYDFVEIMACPGGCIGGGGQPIHAEYNHKKERTSVLYDLDENMNLRFSHENPSIKEVYKTYLSKPGSEKAHKLLHTNHENWNMKI